MFVIADEQRELGHGNCKSREVAWHGAGLEVDTRQEHDDYLAGFVNDFVNNVKVLIERNRQQWAIKHRYYSLFTEVVRHARVCARYWNIFTYGSLL